MTKSEKLFDRALKVMPGGVSSPVRSIKPYPFFVNKAEGSHIFDEEGNEYIDYCMGYGPLLWGHGLPEPVKEKIISQLEKGILYGAPTEIEVKFAELISQHVPGLEMVRLVNSGSEATMGAIRAARGFTGKDKIIKIEGGFHGAHESVLVKAGSGAMGIPASNGIPRDFIKHTIQVPFNDVEAMEESITKYEDDLAAVIMEPIMGNAGVILPGNGYLTEVRRLTKKHQVLLIFDEVITGFRLGLGGAQEYFGVTPDLTTLGKVAGAGLPIGIFGGKREIMKEVAPAGNIYEAGTFNGHPLVLTAGYHLLEYLKENKVYEKVNRLGDILRRKVGELATNRGYKVSGIGSMFKVFFTKEDKVPRNYEEAKRCNYNRWLKSFWPSMLEAGIFLPPSQYETQFISYAHTEAEIERTVDAYRKCL